MKYKYSTDLEIAVLKHFASKANFGIVEIGVLNGEAAKEMLSVCSVFYYAIDPIIPDSMNGGLIGNIDTIHKNCGSYKNFNFIRDYSFNSAKCWKHPFDMIFVDGNHSETGVITDYNDWWPLLSEKGIMLFHDSAPVLSEFPTPFNGHDGPVKLVEELKKKHLCIGTWDTITGFRKT